jgi:cytochrome c551/c552
MKIIRVLYFIPIIFLATFCQSHENKIESGDQQKTTVSSTADSSLAEGERLFNDNCTSCHSIHVKTIGPELRNIDTINTEWLYKWVKSSKDLMKSGDKRANAIFKEYNNILQPDFNLSNNQIDNIVKYIVRKRVEYQHRLQ